MPFWYSPDDAAAFYSFKALVQPVDSMTRRSYSRWGWLVSCGIGLCIAGILFVQSYSSYTGECGLMPFIGGPHPCSLGDHMSSDLTLVIGIGGVVYGPILVGVLLIPPLVGSLLDRRRRASVAQSILLFTALGFLAVPGVIWMVITARRNADVGVVVVWWVVELLCVGVGATCGFVGGVLLDNAD
jgi:hypothetical protein